MIKYITIYDFLLIFNAETFYSYPLRIVQEL